MFSSSENKFVFNQLANAGDSTWVPALAARGAFLRLASQVEAVLVLIPQGRPRGRIEFRPHAADRQRQEAKCDVNHASGAAILMPQSFPDQYPI